MADAPLDPEAAAVFQTVLQGSAVKSNAVQTHGMDADAASVFQQVAAQPQPRISANGQTMEPLSGWQDSMKWLTDRLAISGSSIERAVGGFEDAGGGDFDEIQKRVERAEITQAQKDTESYRNDNLYIELAGVKVGPQDVPGWFLENSATLALTLAGGAAGGMVGGPIGAFMGAALVAGTLESGSQIYALRARKVDRENAIKAGLLHGAVVGGLEAWGLRGMAKLATTAAAKAMGTAGFKEVSAKLLTEMSKSVAQENAKKGVVKEFFKATSGEVATEALESVSQSLSTYIATRNSPGSKPITWDEAINDFNQAWVQALVVAPQMGGVSHVVGTLKGKSEAPLSPEEQAKADLVEGLKEAIVQADEAQLEVKAELAKKDDSAAVVRLTKRIQAENEVHRILAAAKSLFIVERKEGVRKEVSRVLGVLRKMIKNSDALTAEQKNKFYARAISIDSHADLERLGQEFLSDLQSEEMRTEFKAARKRLEAAIEKGEPTTQGQRPKTKLEAGAQQVMTWYKEFFVKPEGKNENDMLEKSIEYADQGFEREAQQQQELQEAAERGELAEAFDQPINLAEKQRIAQEAVRYWNGDYDPAAIDMLTGQIDQVRKGGKSDFQARKDAEAAQHQSDKKLVFEGVQGNSPVVPSQSKDPPKKFSLLDKAVTGLKTTSTALWDKILADTPPAVRDKIVRILDYTKAENKETKILREAATKLNELLEEAAGGPKRLFKLLNEGRKSEYFGHSYTDASGNSQQLGRYSLNELTYFHMALQDPGAIPALVAGNGFTLRDMVVEGETSTQEAIENILADRDGGARLRLANAVMKFYRWFAPVVQNHYLKEYGVYVPLSDVYSGRIYHREVEQGKEAVDLYEAIHSYARHFMPAASTKKRRGSLLPVRAVDPFDQVTRHVSQMAFWVANSEKSRQMEAIFKDSSRDGIRDVINHKNGKGYVSVVDANLDWQFRLRTVAIHAHHEAARWLKNNMSTGFLGGQLMQAPKQWTSVLVGLAEMSPTELFGGIAAGLQSALTGGKEIKKYFSQSDLYADRQDSIVPQVMEAARGTDFQSWQKDGTYKFKEVMMTPLSKWGDGVTSALLGYARYRKAIAEGMSETEAVLAGDRLVDKTQSSARRSQRTPMQYDEALSVFLHFAKQNIQMMNLEAGAIRDAGKHKDKESRRRIRSTIVGIHLAQAMFQLINNLPGLISDDDDERTVAGMRVLAALLGGAFSSIPLGVSDVWEGIILGVIGGQNTREPSTVISRVLKDTLDVVRYTAKMAEGDVDDATVWKAFRSYAAVASVVTGIPFWGAFKAAEFTAEATGAKAR